MTPVDNVYPLSSQCTCPIPQTMDNESCLRCGGWIPGDHPIFQPQSEARGGGPMFLVALSVSALVSFAIVGLLIWLLL